MHPELENEGVQVEKNAILGVSEGLQGSLALAQQPLHKCWLSCCCAGVNLASPWLEKK